MRALGLALLAALLAVPAGPRAAGAEAPARAAGSQAPALGEPGEAASLGVGDALPEVALEDQHGRVRRVDAAVRWVLFSRDMDGGAAVRGLLDPERLGEPPAAFLERLGAVAVADVHGMPGLVRRLIAKPRMRQRPYPLLLDESGEATARWPSAEGRATLIGLDGLRIVSVTHAADAGALARALGAADRPPDGAATPRPGAGGGAESLGGSAPPAGAGAGTRPTPPP